MRYLYLLTCAALINVANVHAAPGDTTWVQAHDNIKLDYYNNFDTSIEFPDGSKRYRKIIMEFTLGKYACPGYDPTRAGEGPGRTGWCSDWDYTVTVQSMNKTGDSLELGRLITPYANTTYARFPLTWKERYYFDVTDFYPALKDTNKIRILYSGYSGGFTANIRFALVEGTPERNITGLKRLWSGSYTYGSAADPIDNHTPVTALVGPAGTTAAAFRFNITGHGADALGCSEFCKRYYRLMKDGSLVEQKDIWRDNCGFNSLYPQSGTWVHNRGNWCPGAGVQTNIHPLSGITAGTSFNLGMNFQAHSSGGGASYSIDGTVVYYGPFNHSLDASLEEILAPTDYEGQYRENPRNGFTTVRVRNSGSTVITKIDFEFGMTGKTLTKGGWSGSLAPATDTIIDLPLDASLLSSSGSNLPYEVNIVSVNGAADEDKDNNRMTSTFTAAPEWPNKFTITLSTNKSTVASGNSETEWRIYDLKSGAIAAERVNNAPSRNYTDSLDLPTGVYKLVLTDAGCDGINFWLYSNPGAYPVNPGVGTFGVKPTLFTKLDVLDYMGGDFGCGFNHYFRVGTPTAIRYIDPVLTAAIEVFPNPASSEVTVQINASTPVAGQLMLLDNTGRVVYQSRMNGKLVIPTGNFSAGLYYISFLPDGHSAASLQSKLTIVR